jgi:membrane associated rhomboid family serine protease
MTYYNDDNPLDQTVGAKKAREWSLVLQAKGIPFELIKSESGGYYIYVSGFDKDIANQEIRLYESENYLKPIHIKKRLQRVNLYYFFAIIGLLILFFIYTVVTGAHIRWIRIGSASTYHILNGQWQRTITALTLHGDIAHLASNMVLGGVAAYGVCRLVGSGLGWLIILLSGVLGNAINVAVRETFHNGIGASTAVFGTVGILSGLQFFARFRLNARNAWLPFAAGLALLGMLGSDIHTDVGAHAFGFAAGIGLGALTGLILSKTGDLGKKSQWALAVITVFIVLYSWHLAIKSAGKTFCCV